MHIASIYRWIQQYVCSPGDNIPVWTNPGVRGFHVRIFDTNATVLVRIKVMYMICTCWREMFLHSFQCFSGCIARLISSGACRKSKMYAITFWITDTGIFDHVCRFDYKKRMSYIIYMMFCLCLYLMWIKTWEAFSLELCIVADIFFWPSFLMLL